MNPSMWECARDVFRIRDWSSTGKNLEKTLLKIKDDGFMQACRPMYFCPLPCQVSELKVKSVSWDCSCCLIMGLLFDLFGTYSKNDEDAQSHLHL